MNLDALKDDVQVFPGLDESFILDNIRMLRYIQRWFSEKVEPQGKDNVTFRFFSRSISA